LVADSETSLAMVVAYRIRVFSDLLADTKVRSAGHNYARRRRPRRAFEAWRIWRALRPGDEGAWRRRGNVCSRPRGRRAAASARLIRGLIRDEDAKWLITRSREIADTLIDASQGRIDVMKDLITRVASETCAEFFGLSVDDPDAFAEWAMSISALLFADPFGNPATRKLGLAGAARVRSVIDAALVRLSVTRPKPREGLGKAILERLVDTGTSPGEIRAVMVGMITGFIPTTTLAAGNIVEQLLGTRGGLNGAAEAAREARNGDESARNRLQQLLFEAARLNPALNPGQWRYALQDGTVTTSSVHTGSPQDRSC
jgi:cytochrome P450